MIRWLAPALLVLAAAALPQSQTLTQGAYRMELRLDKYDGKNWKLIDPGLILASGDRVRFRFKTNFDGYLYVTNRSSSGKYEQLFPRGDTGEDNHVVSSHEYLVPATSALFRIDGPAGYETVYWLVSPTRMAAGVPPHEDRPVVLHPRCDDTILKARGDCVDSSAGPRLVPRGELLPEGLNQPAASDSPDLLVIRQENTSVIASTVPLNGPVIYEYRLAHR
jgi:Domain of unknown function (DUF4384)